MVYESLTIGIAALVTVTPYFFLRRKLQDKIVIPQLGKGQKYYEKAGAGDTLVNILTMPDQGARMCMISDDSFKLKNKGPDEQGEEINVWYQFLLSCLERNVDISIYGSRLSVAEDEIANLISKGLKYYDLEKVPKNHILAIDSPRQLWAEYEHPKESEFAYRCIYTDKPYENVWQNAVKELVRLKIEGELR